MQLLKIQLPMTPATVQDGYFYLLRRYLETIYSGCQAKEVNILVVLSVTKYFAKPQLRPAAPMMTFFPTTCFVAQDRVGR